MTISVIICEKKFSLMYLNFLMLLIVQSTYLHVAISF